MLLEVTHNLIKQRSILQKLAEKLGFHYIKEPEKWYTVSFKDFYQNKVLYCWFIVILRTGDSPKPG